MLALIPLSNTSAVLWNDLFSRQDYIISLLTKCSYGEKVIIISEPLGIYKLVAEVLVKLYFNLMLKYF